MRTANVSRLMCVAFVLLILNASSYPLEVIVIIPEGSSCDLKQEDTTGTCVLVTLCQPAIKSLKMRRSHDLSRCGFSGIYEIVCCPNAAILGQDNDKHIDDSTTPSTNVNSTTSKAEVRSPVIRKSVQVCEELSGRIEPKVSFQILGGVNADLGEFPHMAALGYESEDNNKIEWQCGGSLISEQYVLTAAHCIVNPNNKPPIRVRMGTVDISDDNHSAQDWGIVKITVHQEYQRKRKRNDIALLKLDRVVKYTDNVHPACLYSKPDDPEQGLVITGWGHVAVAGKMSPILQKGIVMPVALDKCNDSYMQEPANSIVIRQNQFCAMSQAGKVDACQGDSGGPIQIALPLTSIYSIIGVTSFGRGCGGSYPGVYTRVHSYLDWIENIVWPK